jgi:hypothetical protein
VAPGSRELDETRPYGLPQHTWLSTTSQQQHNNNNNNNITTTTTTNTPPWLGVQCETGVGRWCGMWISMILEHQPKLLPMDGCFK